MQFQNMADDIDEDEPFVLCGDTNLFTFFPKNKQQLLLDKMIEPISSKTGAVVIGDYKTNYFSQGQTSQN